MSTLLLNNPVETLGGIGPKRKTLLANLGITTVRDLLFHLPRDYRDRRLMTPIAEIKVGETVTIEGEVTRARAMRLRGRLQIAEILLKDSSGTLKATWFNQPYLAKAFKPGTQLILSGKATESIKNKNIPFTLKNPEYESLAGEEDDRLNTGRIVPLYPLTEQVTQRMLRRWIHTTLEQCLSNIEETLPERLRKKHRFHSIIDALRMVHFPDNLDDARVARNRFAYEELLGIQLGVLGLRAERVREIKGNTHIVNGPTLRALDASLPFPLTSAQRRSVDDILHDMASSHPMFRLLQGDVGCGKTIVALHAIAAAVDGGYQTALMVPTEILAEQHGLTLRDRLEPLGVRIESLTGSTPNARSVRARLHRGEIQVVVGTHALLQEKSLFHNLGLVLIDEQHRFGVMQRSRLAAKGNNPDILHLTATPIPRTLAITVYGGMDISVIDELPPGRLPVKTRRIPPGKIPDLYDYIRKEAQEGRQTYYICPLIDESEKRDLVAVTKRFSELAEGPLAGLQTALLHGRLASAEKDAIMHRFMQGNLDVLFSTTVIEVGIDAPKATLMVIEDAAQFGLTQLHQLRGRVGRSGLQAYCLLLGSPKTDDGEKRLEVLCKSSSGFDIAEEDLKLRGPGEFYGVRQAGLSDLHVADLIHDIRLLDCARRDAQEILEHDPAFAAPEHAWLRSSAERFEQLNA